MEMFCASRKKHYLCYAINVKKERKTMKHRVQAILIGLLIPLVIYALPTYYDSAKGGVHQLFKAGKGKYVIRHAHRFQETLEIPSGCELRFAGEDCQDLLSFMTPS